VQHHPLGHLCRPSLHLRLLLLVARRVFVHVDCSSAGFPEFMLHVNLTFNLTSSARAYAGITVLSFVLGLNLPKLDTQAVVIPMA
jgi:hypothetical protein